MTAASDLTSLANRMRSHRKEFRPRISQFVLGEMLGWDERTVRRAESGNYQPSAEYMGRWLEWFTGRGGAEASAAEISRLYDRVACTIDLSWWPPSWGTLGSGDQPAEYEDLMKRRAFLAGGLAFPIGAALEAGPVVKDYENITRALQRAYSYAPARTLMPRITAELAGLEHELGNADRDTLRGLLGPYAELQMLAGHTARWDLMDQTTAARHARLAARSARQAGDVDILAHAFAFHSTECRLRGNHSEAIQAAEEACHLAPATRPATVSYVRVLASQAYGKAGDPDAALDHLDTARNAVAAVKPGSRWRGTGVWGPRRMAVYEAYTLRDLGRHADALAVLSAVPAWDAGSVMYAADHTMSLSTTLLGLGEIESSAKQAANAFRHAQRMQYGDGIRGARQLHAKLASHACVPAVRELDELLRTISPGTG